MIVGDKVELKKTKNWEGYGFENSIITQIGKTLIQIKSETGHTMYVKESEIKLKSK